MKHCFFEFNLRTQKVSNDTMPEYAVRYYKFRNSSMVEIGDGYRHYICLNAKHWNRILRIIKYDELDKSGIKAITRGLMENFLPKEYEKNLISAIKTGIIKEVK